MQQMMGRRSRGRFSTKCGKGITKAGGRKALTDFDLAPYAIRGY
jgi:hypothetical protein